MQSIGGNSVRLQLSSFPWLTPPLLGQGMGMVTNDKCMTSENVSGPLTCKKQSNDIVIVMKLYFHIFDWHVKGHINPSVS